MSVRMPRRRAIFYVPTVLFLTAVILGAGYILIYGWLPLEVVWWQFRVRHGSREARETALRALGEIRDPEALPCLFEALRQDDLDDPGNWRASFAIMRFEGDAIPYLSRALDDPERDQRRRALLILVALEMNRAQPYLARAVRDADPEVRKFALGVALNRCLSWELRYGLARATFDDPDPGVRAAALTAVRDRREDEVVAALLRAAEREDLTTRSAATVILAHLGFKDRIPLVIAWIGDAHLHELNHLPVGRYAAGWLVYFAGRIQTPGNTQELARLVLATQRVANGLATAAETAVASDQWQAWWSRNEAQLRWSEQMGWKLAQR